MKHSAFNNIKIKFLLPVATLCLNQAAVASRQTN